jgi:flavodoxin short chain
MNFIFYINSTSTFTLTLNGRRKMAKALIVYGSTTGNTEYAAGIIAAELNGAGFSTQTADVTQMEPSGLCDGYDLTLFGCSTWGGDSIELQDDFIPFFEHFDSIGVQGKNTAVFGCGLSSYDFFCGAVDAIAQKLNELGAHVLDTLKIDGDPQPQRDEIANWAKNVAANAV